MDQYHWEARTSASNTDLLNQNCILWVDSMGDLSTLHNVRRTALEDKKIKPIKEKGVMNCVKYVNMSKKKD